MENYKLNVGDYVEGVEHVGNNFHSVSRRVRGWVTEVRANDLYIQADDGYQGYRGTCIDTETAVWLPPKLRH